MSNLARKLLSVDLEELCIALEAEGDLRWYFDLATGDVILVTHEYEPADYGGLTVEQLEADAQRFVQVPAVEPGTQVEDMRAWVASLSDVRLKESLELALEAPRPERRFKTALTWLPAIAGAWHAFRRARSEARAREWLEAHGVDATPRPSVDA